MATNATTASMQYNSGVGFFYKRYKTGSTSISQFRKNLENGTLNDTHVVDSFIAGEIKTDNIYETTYG